MHVFCFYIVFHHFQAARVEVNISLAFFHWLGIALHPWPFVSDIAIFVLKGDVKLQLTNFSHFLLINCKHIFSSVSQWLIRQTVPVYCHWVLVLCCLQLLPVCRVSGERPLLEPSDFVSSFKLLHATDSRAAMLNGNYFQMHICFGHFLHFIVGIKPADKYSYQDTRLLTCSFSSHFYENMGWPDTSLIGEGQLMHILYCQLPFPTLMRVVIYWALFCLPPLTDFEARDFTYFMSALRSWCSGTTGRALDMRSTGRRFKSCSVQSCVTTLG